MVKDNSRPAYPCIPLIAAGLLVLMLSGCKSDFRSIDVRDTGAIGDSITVNTSAIQRAIDDLASEGGGTVYIRDGNYVSGTLRLQSGITLHIDKGASLLGSVEQEDYTDDIATLTDGIGQQFGHALIYAADAMNITITGGGTINGRGFESHFSRNRGDKRPSLLRFERVDSLTVKDLNLTNAAFWVQHYRNSSNILVDSVRVVSHSNGNNDGIDVDGSSNVVIRNSYFDTGDDSIVLKSLSDNIVSNILIEQNTIRGNKSAVKTGTESVGGFENIEIRELDIKGTRGINLYTVDGADLKNVSIENVRMDSSYGVLMMRLGSRLNSFDGEENDKTPGTLQNITINGVRATNVSRNNEFIAGLENHPVRSVSITDLYIGYAENADIKVSRSKVPERATAYPKDEMFGPIPAYGMFIRHAEEVQINGLQLMYPVSWDPDPEVPLIRCNNTKNVKINWLISSTDALNQQVQGC